MKHVLLIVLISMSISCVAQFNSAHQTNIIFENRPRGTITGFPPAAPETVGSYYLYQDYLLADIYLKDSTKITGVPIRLDLKDNDIEVRYEGSLKSLPVMKVMSVTLQGPLGTEQFINGGLIEPLARLYKDQLLRIVVDGETALLCSTKTQIKEAQAAQNPMLVSASRENEIVHHKIYLILKDKGFVTTATSKSMFRKEMVVLYGPENESLIKKVNPKHESDLVALVNELNRHKS